MEKKMFLFISSFQSLKIIILFTIMLIIYFYFPLNFQLILKFITSIYLLWSENEKVNNRKLQNYFILFLVCQLKLKKGHLKRNIGIRNLGRENDTLVQGG